MGPDRTPLSNAELAEWVANELRKYETSEKPGALKSGAPTMVANREAPAQQDAEEPSRLRALIAGQQAIACELPHLALTGDFSAAPGPQGGWTVRYSARPATRFGSVALQIVECFVAASGAVSVRKSLGPTTRDPRQTEVPLRPRR